MQRPVAGDVHVVLAVVGLALAEDAVLEDDRAVHERHDGAAALREVLEEPAAGERDGGRVDAREVARRLARPAVAGEDAVRDADRAAGDEDDLPVVVVVVVAVVGRAGERAVRGGQAARGKDVGGRPLGPARRLVLDGLVVGEFAVPEDERAGRADDAGMAVVVVGRLGAPAARDVVLEGEVLKRERHGRIRRREDAVALVSRGDRGREDDRSVRRAPDRHRGGGEQDLVHRQRAGKAGEVDRVAGARGGDGRLQGVGRERGRRDGRGGNRNREREKGEEGKCRFLHGISGN